MATPVTSDKGKARAIDPVSTLNNDHPAIPLVKPQPIPSTSLLNVEYPGILVDDAVLSSSTSSSSLDRALSTLHPSALPPLTSSPLEGLNFLSRIPNEGLRVVECRLGSFPSSVPSEGEVQSGLDRNSIDQVYKAPLIGEVVPTHNIVVRIVKRTWRQKKRKRLSSGSPAQGADSSDRPDVMALDPALFAEGVDAGHDNSQLQQPNGHEEHDDKRSRYTGRVKKEYCIEVLGMATNTVRFRSMADFAFQPEVSTASAGTDTIQELDPVMALHKALATMDLKAFQNFRIPEQLEDYQLPDPAGSAPKSNLHMVPPAFFSRMDVPFNYNYQQTPYSELRTVPAPPHISRKSSVTFAHALRRDNLPAGQMQRFVNRVRLSNITPQPFRVGRDAKVPTRPLLDVIRIEHRCDPKIVARLRELLVERPMWSRVALKNQLTEGELKELTGSNEKVYYALVGYSMVGGPWRDTIVRFGYDVRKDHSSRIYQRIFLRGTPALREPSRTAQLSPAAAAPVDGEGEEDDEADEASAARSSLVPLPTSERSQNTHLFDGTTLHRHVGNFQLCDIEDPLIKPYIWRSNDADLPLLDAGSDLPILPPMGTQWLRSTWDAETGWYTKRALELIRALLAARFKALSDTGTPLESDAVDAIVSRIRQKWREEDSPPLQEGGAQTEAEETSVAQPVNGQQTVIDPTLR
ncbi:hypothetical protein EX895_005214 [Sporisorium graminicola]|uniref:Transcription factor IIIC subunit 5 HTH domain-containing protein n=1 Tax=Sporisorium graminicola TaxID=280036 RepID=A0A4U7KN59_9BASI|nr:hypothetical protein EX895_005214 [Sporisorium graminicola]TKY85674.1 hypothetical protein EX895_005214 [Sporisorium graminicola]